MAIKILTGNEQYSAKRRGGYRKYLEHLLKLRYDGVKPDWDVCNEPVVAWVNQGSWAANCECGGSMIVEPGEPYICPDCVNAAQGGKARPVIWSQDKRDIEDVLVERPFPRQRNYLIGETLEILVDENIAHGHAVPDKVLAKLGRIAPLPEEPPVEEEPLP